MLFYLSSEICPFVITLLEKNPFETSSFPKYFPKSWALVLQICSQFSGFPISSKLSPVLLSFQFYSSSLNWSKYSALITLYAMYIGVESLSYSNSQFEIENSTHTTMKKWERLKLDHKYLIYTNKRMIIKLSSLFFAENYCNNKSQIHNCQGLLINKFSSFLQGFCKQLWEE